MRKLTQVRYVAENFEMLQGLRMIPFGIWFLAMAIGDLAQIPALRQGNLGEPFLLLIAMAGLYWWLGGYYSRTYGQVKQQRKSFVAKLLASWALLLFIAGIVIDMLLELPISFLAIVLSIYFFIPFARALPLLRLHYAFIGLVMLSLSLAPFFVDESLKFEFFAPSGAYFLLGIGGALIVAGVLDHLWLRNMMLPEQEAA